MYHALLDQTMDYWATMQIQYKMEIGKLQYITNYQSTISHIKQVEMAIAAGVDWIQYRPKEVSESLMLTEGKAIAKLCKAAKVCCIMNDNVKIAKAINADGVHLGKSDMLPSQARAILGEDKIIGGTSNTAKDILKLIEEGVDYAGLGPFQFTSTKKNLSPILGFDGYTNIIKELKNRGIDLPILAIGGIGEKDVAGLMQTGIHGIALSSLISEANDKSIVVTNLLRLIKD